MTSTPDEIIGAALKLPESDRLLIAARLLDTLPEDHPGLSVDDDGLFVELERRASDPGATISVSELWKQE